MDCPYCNQELEWHDYFGYFGKYLGSDPFDKKGDIYKCENEECDGHFFYTRGNDREIYEGLPDKNA